MMPFGRSVCATAIMPPERRESNHESRSNDLPHLDGNVSVGNDVENVPSGAELVRDDGCERDDERNRAEEPRETPVAFLKDIADGVLPEGAIFPARK